MPKQEVLVNGQKVEFEAAPRLNILVPDPGMRVEVPSHTEINGRNTLEFMSKMPDKKWQWISTGPLFKGLFNELFESSEIKLPSTIAELMKMGNDVIHASGLIIMCFEAAVERHENVFLNMPEEHLHPKQQRNLVTVLEKIQGLSQEG